MRDIVFDWYLEKDAERISRKNNKDFDKQSEEVKRMVIEMMKEDLEDKYRE